MKDFYPIRAEHTDVGATLMTTIYAGTVPLGQYWVGSRHIETAERVADDLIAAMFGDLFSRAAKLGGVAVSEYDVGTVKRNQLSPGS